jgi:hypothetical protein
MQYYNIQVVAAISDFKFCEWDGYLTWQKFTQHAPVKMIGNLSARLENLLYIAVRYGKTLWAAWCKERCWRLEAEPPLLTLTALEPSCKRARIWSHLNSSPTCKPVLLNGAH